MNLNIEYKLYTMKIGLRFEPANQGFSKNV